MLSNNNNNPKCCMMMMMILWAELSATWALVLAPISVAFRRANEIDVLNFNILPAKYDQNSNCFRVLCPLLWAVIQGEDNTTQDKTRSDKTGQASSSFELGIKLNLVGQATHGKDLWNRRSFQRSRVSNVSMVNMKLWALSFEFWAKVQAHISHISLWPSGERWA